MKTTIKNLKEEIDPYYDEITKDCEILPILYDTIELILKHDISDEHIGNWLYINQDAISVIRQKVQKIKMRNK